MQPHRRGNGIISQLWLCGNLVQGAQGLGNGHYRERLKLGRHCHADYGRSLDGEDWFRLDHARHRISHAWPAHHHKSNRKVAAPTPAKGRWRAGLFPSFQRPCILSYSVGFLFLFYGHVYSHYFHGDIRSACGHVRVSCGLSRLHIQCGQVHDTESSISS